MILPRHARALPPASALSAAIVLLVSPRALGRDKIVETRMGESQNHEDLNRLAYEAAPIGIVLTEKRIIRACNPAFAAMFGFDREALIDQSFAILYPSFEEFVRIRDVGVQALRQTGRYSDERIMARADGTLFWCRVRGTTLTEEGDPLAKAVWSFADLSYARPVTQLSTRERQIIMHLGEGRTSKEIARLLSISPRTVEAHRANLLKKYAAGNVAELLAHLGGVPGT